MHPTQWTHTHAHILLTVLSTCSYIWLTISKYEETHKASKGLLRHISNPKHAKTELLLSATLDKYRQPQNFICEGACTKLWVMQYQTHLEMKTLYHACETKLNLRPINQLGYCTHQLEGTSVHPLLQQTHTHWLLPNVPDQ